MRKSCAVCMSFCMFLISVCTTNVLTAEKQSNYYAKKAQNYSEETQKIHDSILSQYADLLLSITNNMQKDIELVRETGIKSIRKRIGMKLLNKEQEKISNENLENLLNKIKEFITKEHGIFDILFYIQKRCSEEIFSQTHVYNNKELFSLLKKTAYDYNDKNIRNSLLKIYGLNEVLNIFKKHRSLNASIAKQNDNYEQTIKQIMSNSPDKYANYKTKQRNKIYRYTSVDVEKIKRAAIMLKKALIELIAKNNDFKKAKSEIEKQKKSFTVITKTAYVNNILQHILKIIIPYVMSNSAIVDISKESLKNELKDKNEDIQVTEEELNALLEESNDNIQVGNEEIKEDDLESWIHSKEQASEKNRKNVS